ncbi:hypothetical protein L2E82_18345 [Cichorium intybus]|uniref:Uncharacterized protein n=1 Tax=Cichorium intybus TaxID=13427 RepID=A0ACB9FAC6_CICIN|nr:hypothetical protein L2E82_18345 [Cichorium intybus]
MEEQRDGDARNKKSLKFSESHETTDADQGVKMIETTGGDIWFPVDRSQMLNLRRYENFPGNASDGSGEILQGLRTAEDVQMTNESFVVDDDDGGTETDQTASNSIGNGSLVDPSFQIQNFSSGEDDEKFPPSEPEMSFSLEDSDNQKFGGWGTFDASDVSENQEFGWDTNRLDYFRVSPFDVYGDDHLTGIASHGGGGGSRDPGVVVGSRPEHERASDTAVAGGDTMIGQSPVVTLKPILPPFEGHIAGGDTKIPRVPVGISANDCSETLVERWDQERSNGLGKRGQRLKVGPTLEQERGSTTSTGAGGGDRNREVPGGIFANNASDGGEAIEKRLKREGATVDKLVTLVVAMAVIMMVMVIVMVVLIYVMLKREV